MDPLESPAIYCYRSIDYFARFCTFRNLKVYMCSRRLVLLIGAKRGHAFFEYDIGILGHVAGNYHGKGLLDSLVKGKALQPADRAGLGSVDRDNGLLACAYRWGSRIARNRIHD